MTPEEIDRPVWGHSQAECRLGRSCPFPSHRPPPPTGFSTEDHLYCDRTLASALSQLASSDDRVLEVHRLLIEGALEIADDRAYEDWTIKVGDYFRDHPVGEIESRVKSRRASEAK